MSVPMHVLFAVSYYLVFATPWDQQYHCDLYNSSEHNSNSHNVQLVLACTCQMSILLIQLTAFCATIAMSLDSIFMPWLTPSQQ